MGPLSNGSIKPFRIIFNYAYVFRQECIDLKKMNQEQQNVILALKKDLAGAQARLSVSSNKILFVDLWLVRYSF